MDNFIIFVNGHHVLLAETFDGRCALTINHVYAGTWRNTQTACYAAAMILEQRKLAN